MGHAKPLVFCIGASHKSAPLDVRETFFLTDDQLIASIPAVKDKFGLDEIAVLSTCNRFEIMGVSSLGAVTEATLYEAYLALQSAAGPRAFTLDQIKANTYGLFSQDAVRHMFSVAASLDSMVVGETQITGQFKDAFALAAKAQTLGPTLSRLVQEALATAKKVRSQTDIGKKSVSISSAAIDLAKKVFGNLSEQRFLVIGAGEMATVAAKHILSYQPRELFIANRTVERGLALTSDLKFGQAHSLDQLFTLLCQTDIVISSTAATHLVVDKPMVKRAQAARRGRPLLLIDIAMPRDIDPECGSLEDVFVFDIDDLQQVVDQNYRSRTDAAEIAQDIVTAGAAAFDKWLASFAIKPALADFRSYLDDLFTRESSRTLQRELFQSLNEKQREGIAIMLDTIAGRLAADASIALKDAMEAGNADQATAWLQRLFPGTEMGAKHRGKA